MPSFVDTWPQINIPNADNTKILNAWNAGFRLVRLPSETDAFPIGVVSYAVGLGFKVVVDYHPELTTWWNKRGNFIHLAEITRIRTEQLLPFTADQVAIEIINEPRIKARSVFYTRFITSIINNIRAVSPDRWIVISNPNISDIDYYAGPLLNWVPPTGTRLIAALHYYRPFNLTHPTYYLQGTASNNPYPHPYPPSLTQNPSFPLNPPFANDADGNFAVNDWANRSLHFTNFANWCTTYNLSPWVGEAGIFDTIPQRIQWMQQVKTLATANNMKVCWWAWGDEFGYKPSQADAAAVLTLMTTA